MTIPAASCLDLIPPGLRADVKGAPMPVADTVKDWAAFGVAESAGRVQANQAKADALAIVERCEAREAAIAKAVRR